MNTRRLIEWWGLAFAAALGITIVSILWLDAPIARYFFRNSPHVAGLAHAFGTSVIVSGDTALMLILALIRIVRGSLPDYAKALFVACAASLIAFAANDYILKLIFGRYGPYTFLGNPTAPLFNFFQGDLNCVFPSGHMVLSTAFAAVLVREYPRTWPIFAGLLCLGAILLLIGDWHFLSDVIAGLFTGGTAGIMAGELWYRHTRHIAAAE
jgi:membrane-associated phospholipid phosphatase